MRFTTATMIGIVLFVSTEADAFIDYSTDMGWTSSGPIVLSPTAGSGPGVTVTFALSAPFTTEPTRTLIGFQYGSGSGDPLVTLTFSQAVEDVALNIIDLDSGVESLIQMNPVPSSVSGNFQFSGNNVVSSIGNGSGAIHYGSIANGEMIRFRFNQQLSNIGFTQLDFSVMPEPSSAFIVVTYGLLGFVVRRRTW